MSQALVSNFGNRKATVPTGANGASGAVACLGQVLLGIELPATWVTSNITFQGSTDGETFKALVDEDNAVITWTAVAQNQILLALPASPLIGGLTHIKVVSVTSQTTDRAITVLLGVVNP